MTGQLAKFELQAGPLGHGKLVVNDNDLSEVVSGVDLQLRSSKPTVLSVHMLASAGEITGEGIVEVHRPEDFSAKPIIDFLSTIDSEWLEHTVLERSSFDERPMAVALQVLMDWAHGAQR